jgi:hypothetical protein
VEHLDRHPFIYNVIWESLLVSGCTLNFLCICKAHCTVSIINNLSPKYWDGSQQMYFLSARRAWWSALWGCEILKMIFTSDTQIISRKRFPLCLEMMPHNVFWTYVSNVIYGGFYNIT